MLALFTSQLHFQAVLPSTFPRRVGILMTKGYAILVSDAKLHTRQLEDAAKYEDAKGQISENS